MTTGLSTEDFRGGDDDDDFIPILFATAYCLAIPPPFFGLIECGTRRKMIWRRRRTIECWKHCILNILKSCTLKFLLVNRNLTLVLCATVDNYNISAYQKTRTWIMSHVAEQSIPRIRFNRS